MAWKRSPPCFPLSPGWTGGSWRTFIRLRFSPPRRNVSDECVFGCQVAVSRNFSSHPLTATSKAKKRHWILKKIKKFFVDHQQLLLEAKKPADFTRRAYREVRYENQSEECPKTKKETHYRMIVSLLQNNDDLCHSMRNRTILPPDLEIER